MSKNSKKLQSVSTKTGDAGQTSLANGERIDKDQPIVEVIGAVDELNSWLGLIAAKFGQQFGDYRQDLYLIQDDLFYLGAELALSPRAKLSARSLRRLEKKANDLQLNMAEDWHQKFLLPGGTELGGYLDLARSVCRRAERRWVTYSKQTDQDNPSPSPLVLQYLNRLSDYLYLLRCAINHAVEYREQQFEAKSS